MAEHYREIAARLRALTYSTPGIVHFATTLEEDDPSHDLYIEVPHIDGSFSHLSHDGKSLG